MGTEALRLATHLQSTYGFASRRVVSMHWRSPEARYDEADFNKILRLRSKDPRAAGRHHRSDSSPASSYCPRTVRYGRAMRGKQKKKSRRKSKAGRRKGSLLCYNKGARRPLRPSAVTASGFPARVQTNTSPARACRRSSAVAPRVAPVLGGPFVEPLVRSSASRDPSRKGCRWNVISGLNGRKKKRRENWAHGVLWNSQGEAAVFSSSFSE